MKKIFFALFCLATFLSCQKEIQFAPEDFYEARITPPYLNFDVHEDGFLIFDSLQHFIAFTIFMDSSTHGETREVLDNKGFTSLAHSRFGSENSSDTIDTEDQVDYVLGIDSIIQIEGTLFKIIDSSRFILTLHESNYSEYTLEKLKSSDFDSDYMNKIATNPQTDYDLFEFLENNPSGHEDTTTNQKPPKRKFWGWVCTGQQGLYQIGNCIFELCEARHCIFWICGTERVIVLDVLCS